MRDNSNPPLPHSPPPIISNLKLLIATVTLEVREYWCFPTRVVWIGLFRPDTIGAVDSGCTAHWFASSIACNVQIS